MLDAVPGPEIQWQHSEHPAFMEGSGRFCLSRGDNNYAMKSTGRHVTWDGMLCRKIQRHEGGREFRGSVAAREE